MLRIALVSYINTRPFTDGLRSVFRAEELELQLLPPSRCALALATGKCDMALIPVGSLVEFHKIKLLKDYCIGADGAVDSVFIFSQQPIESCDTLLLDEHSRTSNGLARILLKSFWKRHVEARMPETRDFSGIAGATAGVAIGDIAYQRRSEFKYVYDLSAIWKQWTGLPFVFAVWAYHKEQVSTSQLAKVKAGLVLGLSQREQSAEKWAATYAYTIPQATHYLNHSISYEMNAAKHQAFHQYFQALLALEDGKESGKMPIPSSWER